MAKKFEQGNSSCFIDDFNPISSMNLTSSELSTENSSMKSSAIVGNGIDNPIEIDSTEQLTLYYSKKMLSITLGLLADEIWFTSDTTTNLTNVTVSVYGLHFMENICRLTL